MRRGGLSASRASFLDRHSPDDRPFEARLPRWTAPCKAEVSALAKQQSARTRAVPLVAPGNIDGPKREPIAMSLPDRATLDASMCFSVRTCRSDVPGTITPFVEAPTAPSGSPVGQVQTPGAGPIHACHADSLA